MQGSHLGVFPSFYEPWGYTPLEGGALGVASVTTDLSGFGRYIFEHIDTKKLPGVFVLPRLGKKDNEVVKGLSKVLYTFSQYSRQERVNNKIAARKIAEKADWGIMAENYITAHNMSLG